MRWCVVMVKDSRLKHTRPFFPHNMYQFTVSNSSLTVSIFFVEIDEGRYGLGSSVTELSPCSNLLYHLYKAVFFIALFPKAVITFGTLPVLIFNCYTKFNHSHFAYSENRSICVTCFCSTSNDIKIGIVTSQAST